MVGATNFRRSYSNNHSGRAIHTTYRAGHTTYNTYRAGHTTYRAGHTTYRAGHTTYRAGHTTYRAGQRHIVMILDRPWCAEQLGEGYLGHLVEIDTISNCKKSSFLKIGPRRVRRWAQRLCNLLMQVSPGSEEARKAMF